MYLYCEQCLCTSTSALTSLPLLPVFQTQVLFDGLVLLTEL
jgi:hypothetical protein